MTGALSQRRCLNHPEREAAYRCPECRRDFCRECGAEHDGRMLCAACLKKLAPDAGAARRRWTSIAAAGAPLGGFLLGWMFFYYLGQLLIEIPTSFHSGGRP